MTTRHCSSTVPGAPTRLRPTRQAWLRILLFGALVVPRVSAQLVPYGQGCGTAGGATLYSTPDQHLDTGRPFRVTLGGLPATSPGVLVLGARRFDLGLPLTLYGMPGCALYTSLDVTFPMSGVGRPSLTLPIPSTFPCMRFYLQGIGFDPAANRVGLITSNGATLVLNRVAETDVHVATSANIVGNSTFISRPELRREPGAIAFYTANYNPGGALAGVYNNHPTGLWYKASTGKWAVFNQDRAAIPRSAAFNILLPNSAATTFVATGTPSTINGHRLSLDHPSLNGQPGASVFVSQSWNPQRKSAVYNNAVVGVWYNSTTRKWEVFNQGKESMPVGASFHVLVADSFLARSAAPFVHVATTGNVGANSTYLTHGKLDGRPDAKLLVTQLWQKGSGVYNPSPIGVRYNRLSGKWGIFNQDGRAMRIGAAFNVLIGEDNPRGKTLLHTATTGTIAANTTVLDDPLLNGRRDAIAFVTPLWTGHYNPHATGVFYSTSSNKWAVFNQDMASMPVGANFNVMIPNDGATKLTVVATTSRLSGHRLELDHPKLNGNPRAIVFVTPNWNPPGRSGVYNRANIGVSYNQGRGRWEIVNQGFEPMRTGASFNVLIADERLATELDPFVFTVRKPTGNMAWIDHWALNGSSTAQLTVTQSYNPPGSRGVYNNHPIGVFYDRTVNKWAVFNQDRAPMPAGASFNVLLGGECR